MLYTLLESGEYTLTITDPQTGNFAFQLTDAGSFEALQLNTPVYSTLEPKFGADPIMEGILFGVKGGISSQSHVADSLHLVNCSFAGNSQPKLFDMSAIRDKPASPEIVNCWAPGVCVLFVDAGASISIRNSIVGRLGLHTSAAGSGQIEIERSAIWNPGAGAMPTISLPTCAFCGHFNSRLKVSLDHVLVETDGGLLPTAELDPFEWKNGHNLYRTSAANIVERLRCEVKSGIRAP